MADTGRRGILVVGATSAIAQEAAKLFAADGDALVLVARDADKLAIVAADLKVRGAARVDCVTADANDFDRHDELIDAAERALGRVDVVLIAHGTLGDQLRSQQSWAETERELRTNLLSTLSLVTRVANRFEEQRGGSIVVVSSVAGDRGRQSNYVYGSAKAGVSAFLAGARNRLHAAGVHVMTVKPGFVDTPMTAHLPKNALFVGPERVGKTIYDGVRRRRDVVYVPRFWRPVMLLIRSIPEAVFKRLRL